jgi:hypothetical protein
MRFLACLLLLAFPAGAQITATLSGHVTDQTDAAVPGATVSVESAQLSIKRTATSGQNGFFSLTALPVGTYKVTVSAPGFQPYTLDNVKLDVGGTLEIAAQLKVGDVKESVTVTAETYQLVNQEHAQVESLISGEQVRELALNGRNWVQLVNLAPGASALINDAQQGTSLRVDDSAINGLRRRTAPTIDGISNVDHGSVGTQVNNISVDAIQEFKLVASPYSAEYGAQAGPAINVVTKRGTNEIHGSLFEFFRHDQLNAYTWESKQAAKPEKPYLRYNNFGGFAGGPVIKDKLFLFGGQEYKKPRTGRSLSQQVPTMAMRRGDFSAVSAPILDKSASTTGVAFAGNVIPQAKMSPNGARLVNLYPEPNSGLGTFIGAPVTVRDVREDLIRADYQATPNANLFFRWVRDGFNSDNPLGSSFDNQALPIAPDNHVRIGKTAVLGYNQVLSSTWINEATVGWQRNDQEIVYQDPKRIDRATYGINFTEIFAENRLNKIPEFTVQGYPQLSGNGLPYKIDHRSWEFRDTMTKSAGVHTLKFGVLFINSLKSENFRARDGGIITFSAGNDAGASFRPQDAGHAVANLLLGAYTRYTEVSNTTNAPTRYNQFEVFLNDTWRIHRRLSLTLGLRYQYIPWPHLDYNNLVSFDPSRFDPNKAPLTANIVSGALNLKADPTGQQGRAAGFYDPYNGLALPGCGFPSAAPLPQASDANLKRLFTCRPSGYAQSGARWFAPRFGFAWDPFGNGKTSVRGGAGVFYDRTLLNPLRDAGNNRPFAESATVTNGRQYTTAASVVPTFSSPLDTVGVGLGGAISPLVQTLAIFAPDMPPGAVYSWSFGVQRELPWATVIDLNYVGNQARHLTHRRDLNYILPEVALARNAAGGFVNATADTVRQFLGYGAIRQQENTGVSSYNSFQASLQKRTTHGFTGSLAYTWGKALNTFDVETSDQRVPFDSRLDKSYAQFDRRHILAFSYVYEFPWRKQQRGFLGRALGGWQVSGTTSIQSGLHVNLSGGSRLSSSPSNGFAGNLDLTGDWRAVPGGQSPDRWVNPAAFTGRAGLIATLPRNLIEMPAGNNWNVSFMKRTQISERLRLQFRAELFNFFNHPNFRTLSTNYSAANFGRLTQTDEPRVLQFGLKLLF